MTFDPNDVVIRVVDDEDVGALANLRALWSGAAEQDPGFELRIRAWLAAEGERRTTWLATVDDRPVGMVSLFEYRRMPKPRHPDSRWGYVGNLFVRDDHRGREIGSALLGAVIAAADRRSYARLVVSPSAEALSLYRRNGFVSSAEASGTELLLVRPGSA